MSQSEVEPPVWKVQYAPSGRASCRKCKFSIDKGLPRIGKEFSMPGRDFRSTYWWHVDCTPVPRKGLPEADIEGFEDLKEVDKQTIRNHLSGPKKTKRKSTATTKSDSGRATKKLCRLPPGWDSYKSKDLKNLCAERNLPVSGKKDELISRLEEWQERAKNMDPALEKKERKQYAEYEKEFSAMTVSEMKKLLKINGQKMSGKKAELIERCADAKLYGALPKCEECGGGRLQVIYDFPFGHKGQGKWLCKGYYDDGEYSPCFFRSRDPQERPKWIEEEESDEE